MFNQVASVNVTSFPANNKIEQYNDLKTDFDNSVKNKLINIITEVENTDVPKIDDNHKVKVHLKDESIFAHSLRRFAFQEK